MGYIWEEGSVINEICTTDPMILAYKLQGHLRGHYNEKAFVVQNNSFLYSAYEPIIKGDNVCIVVHLDTVGVFNNELRIMQDVNNPHLLYHNGGGYFDDRAGVLALLELIDSYHYPYIIFTGEEETGCEGSIHLINDYDELDLLFPDNNIQCLIQLDRHGDNEVVFYDLEYPEFEKIFTRYFKKEEGIYSDISVLAPYWGIAAANLSVGYHNEHSMLEYLNLNSLEETLVSLIKILPSFYDYSREDRWIYKGNNDTFQYLISYSTYNPFYDEVIPYNKSILVDSPSEGNFVENIESKNDIL